MNRSDIYFKYNPLQKSHDHTFRFYLLLDSGTDTSVKEINANNQLVLKTVISYYSKKNIKIQHEKKDEKYILSLFQKI